MNLVFWLLVGICAVVLWFIISFVFSPLGIAMSKKWDKTMEILNKDEKEEEELVEDEKSR